MFVVNNVKKIQKQEKESIHSGHFMVSHFEAEEQDDEDELAVPIPEVTNKETFEKPIKQIHNGKMDTIAKFTHPQQIAIETSLSKLFHCMSLAYRQKLTSPKWNRFRGIRLRWKDKIRLNNVIWRCWHMQFIKKENTLICQFASPLDVDTHNKPEAVVLEGKYWKRKLAAVTAEYKKWRMFYRNLTMGHSKDSNDIFNEMELMKWDFQSPENVDMLVDEDYMGLMSDTLFSTITNQPFAFPDTREIAKAGLADFIQPSLGPLQPNLPNNDFMDTMEHFDLLSGKLPTVQEEHSDGLYKWGVYNDLELMNTNPPLQINSVQSPNTVMDQYASVQPVVVQIQDTRQPAINYDSEVMPQVDSYTRREPQNQATYQSTVISKNSKVKDLTLSHQKANQSHMQGTMYTKPMELYQNYTISEIGNSVCPGDDPLQLPDQHDFKILQPTDPNQSSQGYRIIPHVSTNLKYTSQLNNSYKLPPRPHHSNQGSVMAVNTSTNAQKEEKITSRMRASRGKQRSRSSTREPIKRPPLQSAVSDPSLITPSSNMILTQLLTNSETVYPRVNTNVHPSHDTSIHCKEENSSQICILPHSSSNPIIITPVISSTQNSPDTLLHSSLGSNSSLVDSQPLQSPTSPQGSLGSPSREPREQRRAGHIHAEQKRRYNIKNGFDMIHSLIPHLNQNPNAKLSKAAMLQKGAEYIMQLRVERDQLKEEMESLRQQIDSLNTSISNCQSLLPATGAPVSRRRDSKMQEMFDEYVKRRTMENWKFWIFSLLFKPLLASFNNFVSTSSLDDLYRSTLHWIEQHCTLGALRPVVLNSLRYLSTKTDILTDPAQLPEEARKHVIYANQNSSNEL